MDKLGLSFLVGIGIGIFMLAVGDLFIVQYSTIDERIAQKEAETARTVALADAARWCVDNGQVNGIGCSRVLRDVSEAGAMVDLSGLELK